MKQDPMRATAIEATLDPIFNNKKIKSVWTLCAMVELYGRLVEHHALVHRRLDGLNYHTGDTFPYFPSWIPNFHSKKRMFSLIEGTAQPGAWLRRHEPIFDACLEEKPRILRHGVAPDTVLEVVGIKIAQ